jgi:conjugal transfer pilus assembly protein TraF
VKSYFCIALLCFTGSALAAEGYYKREKEGWFWYESIPEVEEKEPPEKPREVSPTPAPPMSAKAELEEIQKKMEEAEARAVLYPNEQNLKNYMHMNKWRLQQSAEFSDVWRRVVWTDPSLDYSLQRPNNNTALQVYHDERKDLYAKVISDLSHDYGIWFFFRGSCPYCHRFSPIMAEFSRRYGIDVLPITLDGGTLPEFPNPKFDLRVAEELDVTVVPSVYLVNPRTRDIVHLSNGLLSQVELAERIYVLTQTKPGEDY